MKLKVNDACCSLMERLSAKVSDDGCFIEFPKFGYPQPHIDLRGEQPTIVTKDIGHPDGKKKRLGCVCLEEALVFLHKQYEAQLIDKQRYLTARVTNAMDELRDVEQELEKLKSEY